LKRLNNGIPIIVIIIVIITILSSISNCRVTLSERSSLGFLILNATNVYGAVVMTREE